MLPFKVIIFTSELILQLVTRLYVSVCFRPSWDFSVRVMLVPPGEWDMNCRGSWFTLCDGPRD